MYLVDWAIESVSVLPCVQFIELNGEGALSSDFAREKMTAMIYGRKSGRHVCQMTHV